MSSGGTQLAYPITHPGDTGTTFHSTTTLTDAGGLGSKVWTFDNSSADAGFGLQVQFDSLHSGTSKSRSNPVWTLDALNRPYMSSVYKTLEPGASNQVQSHTDQTIDPFRNLPYLPLSPSRPHPPACAQNHPTPTPPPRITVPRRPPQTAPPPRPAQLTPAGIPQTASSKARSRRTARPPCCVTALLMRRLRICSAS